MKTRRYDAATNQRLEEIRRALGRTGVDVRTQVSEYGRPWTLDIEFLLVEHARLTALTGGAPDPDEVDTQKAVAAPAGH